MQYSTFNRLLRHVHSVEVGSFADDCETFKSLGDSCEFFLVTEFVDEVLNHADLDRVKIARDLSSLDEERYLALSDCLVEILGVVQLFYAWLSLVLASPLWDLQLPTKMRKKILRFATKVLKAERFDFESVKSYLE
jgi:hypothetical protein